jgi:hypothetical protein
MSLFKKAQRARIYLKIGLMGPSGSGKTHSALLLAQGLANGGKIAVIDTENGSASLYSHVTDFDVADMEPPFDTEKYIAAIKAAEEAGYAVLVIDSFSHAWKYLLDKKERLDSRGGNQNRYTNWGPVKADADRLKDAILQSKIHVISCMRSKTEYTQENGKVQKVGMAAIQEPDVEYEFTTVFLIDMTHSAQATKDRTTLFGSRIFQIEPKTGSALLNWLGTADSQETYIPAATTTEPKPHDAPTAPEFAPIKVTLKALADNSGESGKDDYKGLIAMLKSVDEPQEAMIQKAYAAGSKTYDAVYQFARAELKQRIPAATGDDRPAEFRTPAEDPKATASTSEAN